jgi:hypothetical protein
MAAVIRQTITIALVPLALFHEVPPVGVPGIVYGHLVILAELQLTANRCGSFLNFSFTPVE